MRNIFRALREKWATRTVEARKKLWDREYALGFGERLKLPEELDHHQKLVEFLVDGEKNKRILDVGCGEGLILDFLQGYESYLGVDFSEVALQAASKRADAKTVFVQAEAESFVPAGEFDAIIFNECLYCFAEPLEVARHYGRFLRGDGVMVVSLFVKTERVKRLGEELSKRYEVVRKVVVKNERGSWECILFKEKG